MPIRFRRSPRPGHLHRMRMGLVAVGATMTLAVACGSPGSPAPAPTSTTPAGASGASGTGQVNPPASTGGTLPQGTATIDSVSTALGTLLVNGSGFVLYVNLDDTPGRSSCADACAKVWPPLTGTSIGVANGIAVTPGKFTLVQRPDGSRQLTVNGRPLYRYAADTQQGQAAGQGLGGIWFAVSPDGTPIRK